MSEPPRYEQTEDLEYDLTPEGASPWLVAMACREIIEDAGLDPYDEDIHESLDMIVHTQDPELALTTAISVFEALGLQYERFFGLLAEKQIIEKSRSVIDD